MQEEDDEPDQVVPTSISSSSPDEAIAPYSPFLPDDHRQYQQLLQRVAAELQIPLEDVQDTQHKLLDILQPPQTQSGSLPSE